MKGIDYVTETNTCCVFLPYTCLYFSTRKETDWFFLVSFQWWVWFAISAQQQCHGNGVEQQQKHAIPTVIHASRRTINSATSIIFAKIAPPRINVLRRPTFFVNEALSATSTAVIATTATLALYFSSVASCSWHALWYLWCLYTKLEIEATGKTGTTQRLGLERLQCRSLGCSFLLVACLITS